MEELISRLRNKEIKLTEYIILHGAGIVESDKEAIGRFIRSEVEKGFNLYLLRVPQDLKPFLMSIGEKGRSLFLRKIGDYLNEIKATRENKREWRRLMQFLNEDAFQINLL
jgi:hypothetical protein